jgi:hypothetical protein
MPQAAADLHQQRRGYRSQRSAKARIPEDAGSLF